MDAVTLTVSLPQALDMGLGEKEGQLEPNLQYLSLTNWAIRQIQANFMLEDTLTSSILGLSNSLLVSKTRKCFPIYSITDSHRMTSREFYGKEGENCWFIISPSLFGRLKCALNAGGWWPSALVKIILMEYGLWPVGGAVLSPSGIPFLRSMQSR